MFCHFHWLHIRNSYCGRIYIFSTYLFCNTHTHPQLTAHTRRRRHTWVAYIQAWSFVFMHCVALFSSLTSHSHCYWIFFFSIFFFGGTIVNGVRFRCVCVQYTRHTNMSLKVSNIWYCCALRCRRHRRIEIDTHAYKYFFFFRFVSFRLV